MLSRLGLMFLGAVKIGNERNVNEKTILSAYVVSYLLYRFDKRKTLYISGRTPDLGYDYVGVGNLSDLINETLDFVRDMRNDLNGSSEILSFALLPKTLS